MAQHVELINSLRASGHRLTPQRESVLSVVAEAKGHLTAEEVLERVRRRYPYLNKSAVYRNLEMLTELGLLTVTDLGHGHVEYELFRQPHHHLVCQNCKQVEQVDHSIFDDLQKRIETEYGFRPALDHFAIFGICRKCQSKGLRNPNQIEGRK